MQYIVKIIKIRNIKKLYYNLVYRILFGKYLYKKQQIYNVSIQINVDNYIKQVFQLCSLHEQYSFSILNIKKT